jgi:hypothetical protein
MRWIRTDRRFGSWLGLAALTLHFVLSFGHIHLEGISGGDGAASAAQLPRSQSSPAQHPANDADDYCAICATIHLASSSLLPDVPQMPLPLGSRSVAHFDNVGFIFVAPQRAAFQSRAPPFA